MRDYTFVTFPGHGIGDIICAHYIFEGIREVLKGDFVFFSQKPKWSKLFFNNVRDFEDIENYQDDSIISINMSGDKPGFTRAQSWSIPVSQKLNFKIKPKRPEVFFDNFKPALDYEYIVLAPFCSGVGSNRNWPIQYYEILERNINKLGIRTIILEGRNSEDRTKRGNFKSQVFFQLEPKKVCNIVKNSILVVGNDSGIVHIAGVLEKEAIAIHSIYDKKMLWGEYTSITSVCPSKNMTCRFCYMDRKKGYMANCWQNCALQSTIPVTSVFREVKKILNKFSISRL